MKWDCYYCCKTSNLYTIVAIPEGELFIVDLDYNYYIKKFENLLDHIPAFLTNCIRTEHLVQFNEPTRLSTEY